MIKDKLNTLSIIINRLLYIITTLLIIISAYNYNQNNILLKLESIIVEGAYYLNEDEIKALIVQDDKMSIFDYDIANIKRTIEKKVFIKSVEIKIKDFNTLHIQIQERTPIALIDDNEKQKFIDIDNIALPIDIKSLNSFPVPVINIKEKHLSKHDKKRASSILKYILSNYPNMYDNISEINISKSLITIITDKKTLIYANPDMAFENINKLQSFEKSIENYKEINDHQYINLIYDKQIVVKERDYL